MNVREAIAKVEKEYPTFKVDTALDVGNLWVFGFCGLNGEEVDVSPCSYNKESGEILEFFPPDHLDELSKAVEIEF